jgi:hypothetical protein
MIGLKRIPEEERVGTAVLCPTRKCPSACQRVLVPACRGVITSLLCKGRTVTVNRAVDVEHTTPRVQRRSKRRRWPSSVPVPVPVLVPESLDALNP